MKQYFAFIFFIFCALVFTYPSVFNFSSKVIGDGGDNYEYLSYQYLVADNLSKGNLPFANSDVFRYPVGFNFSAAAEAKLAVLIGGILNPILGGTLAYNLILLFILVMNGYLAFLFFKALTSSYELGLFGGLGYGFSYYVLARGAGHLNLVQIYCFPLCGYLLIKYFRKRNYVTFLLFVFSLLIMTLCSLQYLLMAIIFFLISLPLVILFFGREIRSVVCLRRIIFPKVILIMLFFGGLFFVILSPYLLPFLKKEMISPPLFYHSLPIEAIFRPSQFSTTILARHISVSLSHIEYSLFIGFIEIVLFFVFVLKKKNKLEWFILINLLIFFVFSLGAGVEKSKWTHPYYFLFSSYPFRAISETGRFFVIYYLLFFILIVMLLKPLLRSAKGKIIFYCLFLGIFLERITNNYYLSSPLEANYQKAVISQKGEAVLDIPILFSPNTHVESHYNLLPFYYQKKITGGYFNWFADSSESRSFIYNNNYLRCFICDDIYPVDKLGAKPFFRQSLLSYLKQNNVSIIVIHKSLFSLDICYNARQVSVLVFPDLSQEEASINYKTYEQLKKYRETNDFNRLPARKVTGISRGENEQMVKIERIYEDSEALVYILE